MDTTTTATDLVALHRHEEGAAGGYLLARRAAVAAGARFASLGQLVIQHPTRLDYRAAWHKADDAYHAAVARARQAYAVWQRAAYRYDQCWTAHQRNAVEVASSTPRAA